MNGLPQMEHIQVENGDVLFPVWARALAWVLGLGMPIAGAIGFWIAGTIFDMSVRMARIEAQLVAATDDRYRKSQADDAHAAIDAVLGVHEREIRELQRLHGRGSPQ